MQITQKYIPIGTKRRSGQKLLGVRFIVCHDTGNANSNALQNVNYYINSCNEESASAHAFVDNTGVIECVPLDEKAWHVRYNVLTDNQMFGVDANDYAIGVELCFFPKDKDYSLLAYNNYVEYIANLCKKYNLDPNTKLVAHSKLDPTRRTDPQNAFNYIGKNWLSFISDVEKSMGDEMVCLKVPKSSVDKVLAFIKGL